MGVNMIRNKESSVKKSALSEILINWERFSSIRNRPRRIIDVNSSNQHYYFPINKQPLCSHKIVKSLKYENFQNILLQSAYKFFYEISDIEINLVTNVALTIVKQKKLLSDEFKQAINTIIIDEVYHALVAEDYISQLELVTAVPPIYVPSDNSLTYALKETEAYLTPQEKDFFKIIAVCIAENSVTKELVTMSKSKDVDDSFQQVNADHLIDEGRHSQIFTILLKDLWHKHLPNEIKEKIIEVIPYFIKKYLDNKHEKLFANVILKNLGFSDEIVDEIIAETYFETDLLSNPVMLNIVELFKRTDMLNDKKLDSILKSNKMK